MKRARRRARNRALLSALQRVCDTSQRREEERERAADLRRRLDRIIAAERFGEAAAREMRGEIAPAQCPCGCGAAAKRWSFAERAAHAAFCAVPGLRETGRL